MTDVPDAMADPGVIHALLSAKDWPFTVDEDDGSVMYRLEGDELAWSTRITVVPETQRAVVMAELPVVAPPDKRVELAVWAARANDGLAVGSFDVDLDDGSVWCRTGIDVEDDRLSPALLNNLLMTNAVLVNRYGAGLLAWLDGDLPSAEAALEHAEADI